MSGEQQRACRVRALRVVLKDFIEILGGGHGVADVELDIAPNGNDFVDREGVGLVVDRRDGPKRAVAKLKSFVGLARCHTKYEPVLEELARARSQSVAEIVRRRRARGFR